MMPGGREGLDWYVDQLVGKAVGEGGGGGGGLLVDGKGPPQGERDGQGYGAGGGVSDGMSGLIVLDCN